jgi:hypothetical protein
MSTSKNTKLCDFTSTNNNDLICTTIAPPAPEANFDEIKPALLNLFMKEQFSGVTTDDVVAHLNNFVELCEMQKYKDIDGDIIKLKLFPFSLRGRAKDWLLSLPRKIYDMLGLPSLENCCFDVPLADVAKKKPLGMINDVLIMVKNNLVPVDFLVLDIECNVSCPIILGRPFLKTIGAIIDMKEGTIKYHSHSRKVWNTSLERDRSYFLTLSLEQIMNLMLHHLKILDSHFLRLPQRR